MLDLTARLADLKAKAERATPGPWQSGLLLGQVHLLNGDEWLDFVKVDPALGGEHTATYIANVSPKVVLAFITVAESECYCRTDLPPYNHDAKCERQKALADLEVALR